MSRIVIFAPGIDAFGGVERLIVDLSRFLHGAGLPHTVLCLSQSIDLAAHADWPMEVHALEAPRNPLAEARALAGYFRDRQVQAPLFFDLKGAFYAGLARCPDFHLHLTDPPSLLPMDVSKHAPSLRARFPGAPSLAMSLRGEAVHRINRRGVRRARSLIAMTHVIADELEALYGRRAGIVRPGIQPPAAPPRPPPSGPGTIRFLSVSRLETSKRIDWMMQALAGLDDDWALDIVGDGSQGEALRRLTAELGVSDRVVFHGRLSDEALDAQFARAGVFLMPAVQGYGLPALEALARGAPVILHRQSGVSEVLEQGPWVQTIEHGAEDLAAAIKRMTGAIRAGALLRQPPPPVPTAADWAQNIAAACGWEH